MKDWYINSYGVAIHISMATSIRIQKQGNNWQVWAYFYSLDGIHEDSEIDCIFLIEKDTQEECKQFIKDLVNGNL